MHRPDAPSTDDTTIASISGETAQPFLNAHLEQLSQQTVTELHARFQAKQHALVDAAFALAAETLAEKNMTPESFDTEYNVTLREAAAYYALACARTRIKISAAELARQIVFGVESLMDEADELLDTQNELEQHITHHIDELKSQGRFQTLQKARADFNASSTPSVLAEDSLSSANKNNDTPSLPPSLIALPWDANDRIYFQLNDNSRSPIEESVAAYLIAQGYRISDYAGNRALDRRKNERKIGKLLKDNVGLHTAFIADTTRSTRNLMVVITRNVNDIARGSIDRGWRSCRADVTRAATYAAREANVGVMSAYLVSADDPDIHNPLARINIKPYDRIIPDDGHFTKVDHTDTIYAPFNPIGLHNAGFVDAIYRFVDALNDNKTGHYHLRPQCESFREYRQRHILPKNAEAALTYLGVKYTKDDNGIITVDGHLDIKNKGLIRLPDLSDVIVTGQIDISGNRLLTLEGMPQNAVYSLNARDNLLLCFAGAAATVEAGFDYRDNPWLVSTYGAPRAFKYIYGNSHDRDEHDPHYARGCLAIGPIEEPSRFPGFKRSVLHL